MEDVSFKTSSAWTVLDLHVVNIAFGVHTYRVKDNFFTLDVVETLLGSCAVKLNGMITYTCADKMFQYFRIFECILLRLHQIVLK